MELFLNKAANARALAEFFTRNGKHNSACSWRELALLCGTLKLDSRAGKKRTTITGSMLILARA